VRAGECICPFCGAKAPCAKPLRSITERLSRAAMNAAGAAGAVVALSDCTNTQSYPGYGGVCVPDACGGYVEQDTGADTTVIAEASVGSPDASDASSTADTSEPDASDGGESEAATDAPSDAPDGG
jgi:hypothetical protein